MSVEPPGQLTAVDDALATGRALVKFISPNDAGTTDSHQSGFYLPKGAWEMFSPNPPVKGVNSVSDVEIAWDYGLSTQSAVHWYGRSKNEYRLTRFGQGFRYRDDAFVGSLLVLVIESHKRFRAYVLTSEDQIDLLKATLGLELVNGWAAYGGVAHDAEMDTDECLAQQFREVATALKEFPSTSVMSEATQAAVLKCLRDFSRRAQDDRLQQLVDAEYRLFQIIEEQLCLPHIRGGFSSVHDFLQTAGSVLNRRKSRAGRSLENHVAFLLRDAGIPFTERAREIDGEPDILIPGVKEYLDPAYPTERICMVGVKTTCRDRWRQVLNEARRLEQRHILTMQPSISTQQLKEMAQAQITLVVPKSFHRSGYTGAADAGARILTVDAFFEYAETLRN